ncbi:hypothetical protein J3459_018203 [Metarhizium acridum]|nr:hypothetical protein J3459_018203 [Metarhizium acridum]
MLCSLVTVKQQLTPSCLFSGAAACTAVCFTHPLDQTKYRMQVLKSSNSMLSTMYRFGLRDGIPSLWGGLSASILRQGTYSTARFGLHNYLSSRLLHTSGRDRLPASWNIACAGVSGGIAGLIGNPTEIVLVRMCADGAKPAGDRFQYPNPLVGLWRVWKEEGAKAFGRGIGPNVTRSVLMSTFCQTRGPGICLVWC